MNIQPFESKIDYTFRNILKGNNFMTLKILGYIELESGDIAEISTGPKFLDIELFGVTVVGNNQRKTDLDICLNSMEEVEEYIKKLNYQDLSYLIDLIKKL